MTNQEQLNEILTDLEIRKCKGKDIFSLRMELLHTCSIYGKMYIDSYNRNERYVIKREFDVVENLYKSLLIKNPIGLDAICNMLIHSIKITLNVLEGSMSTFNFSEN